MTPFLLDDVDADVHRSLFNITMERMKNKILTKIDMTTLKNLPKIKFACFHDSMATHTHTTFFSLGFRKTDMK